ncbi:TlpA disulfide reductase family protein [uncultured Arcticibacterium sp.]|uniref:TlpA disulfide reductase family protein n=1 Tax=uncultured Arcticibacterium sp. TaxID=2173042 RepID=UPI0030F92FCD
MTIKTRLAKTISGTLFFLTLFSFSCNSQKNPDSSIEGTASNSLPLVINGTLKNNLVDKVYLERMSERNIPTRVDSSAVSSELKFSFNTTIPEPGIYQINMEGQQVIGLILDGGETLDIVADGLASPDKMPEYTVTGSKNIDTFNKIMTEVQNFGKLRQSLETDFQNAKNPKAQEELRGQYQMALNNNRETIKPLISDLGTSLSGIIAANNFLTPELDGAYLTDLKAKLVAEGQDHYFAKIFIETIDRQSGGMEGSPAPDFDLVNLKGEQVKLSDMRGKTVIIDFWATWCGPCIRSFPGMKQAQDKYADNADVVFLFVNTFERVAPEQWKSHVQNFVDKRGYQYLNPPLDINNSTALAYGVEGIPAKFCIDKDGNIKHKSTGFLGSSEAVYNEMVEWVEGK